MDIIGLGGSISENVEKIVIFVVLVRDGKCTFNDADQLEEGSVFFHDHELRDCHVSGTDYAVKVMPDEVDDHEVFCAFFWGGQEGGCLFECEGRKVGIGLTLDSAFDGTELAC